MLKRDLQSRLLLSPAKTSSFISRCQWRNGWRCGAPRLSLRLIITHQVHIFTAKTLPWTSDGSKHYCIWKLTCKHCFPSMNTQACPQSEMNSIVLFMFSCHFHPILPLTSLQEFGFFATTLEECLANPPVKRQTHASHTNTQREHCTLYLVVDAFAQVEWQADHRDHLPAHFHHSTHHQIHHPPEEALQAANGRIC